MTLVEFLLARIAEDEASARASMRESSLWATARNRLRAGHYTFALTATPNRVLAECAAKRRIVERVVANAGVTVADDWVLNLLALPYADHPDYRAEWRP